MNNTPLAGIGIKPQVSLRKHAQIAVLVFVVVLLGGLPIVWIKGKPKFETESVIQVSPRYMKTLKDDNELDFQSNSQYRQFVQQQTNTILREDILRDAIHSLAKRPESERWQHQGESDLKSTRRLRTSLLVLPVPDTYMVRIVLSGSKAQGLAPIVNAVTKIYIERSRDEQVFGKDERTVLLRKRQQALLRDIDDKAERRNSIAGELGIATFSAEAGNPYDKAIERLREALADTRIKRFDAESREKAFLQHGETDPSVRSIQESVAVDPGLNSLKASLNNRRATLVSNMTGLTDKHPGYQQNRQELSDIESEISTQTDKLTQSVRSNLENRFATASDQARQLETDIQDELARQEQSRGRFATLFKEAQHLSAEIDQVRKELDSIGERLNFFAAETGSFGFVRLVTAAPEPDLPIGPGKKKLLLGLILAAILASVLVPVAIDLLDRRIHAPNDISGSFGFPPLGWLVEASDADSHSFRADQLRRLASALIREQDRSGLRIFGVCALQPGGGASTLVRELQATFSSMGLQALAVDANAFRRDASCAMLPELDLANPHYPDTPLSALKLAAHGRHLQAIDRLGDTLTQLAEQYRFVLVDVPPLLASSDAELTLRATPGILAVVEAEEQIRGEVSRAARILQGIDPDSIGVVVNRVRPLNGGGYVRDLMTEFLTGRKPEKAGLVRELQHTSQQLAWAARNLFQQTLQLTRRRRTK